MAVLYDRKRRYLVIAGICLMSFLLWYFKGHKFFDGWSTYDFEWQPHDDPRLIKFIRHRMVHPPAKPLPYNLVHSEFTYFSQNGPGLQLQRIFGDKRNGFFVESGVVTGEANSPTLFWEREKSWNGVLVEPHPYRYSLLADKTRRSVILHAGLSLTNEASTLTFIKNGSLTAIVNAIMSEPPPSIQYSSVPCFPLTSILAAMGTPKVDLLSLNIDGFELNVLFTLNLTILDISVVMFEYTGEKSYPHLKKHLEKNGYEEFVKSEHTGFFVKIK